MNQQEINNSSMLKKGTILRGIYRIDSYLSSGGFGNTYVATNIEFGERVAIKEFFMKGVTQRDGNQMTVSVSNAENTNSFLEQKEKFKKEARRIRQLKNEHIVAVYDLFDENETSYYVMDYVDGENLAERMRRTGRPMEESEVRLILPQILDALKAVHEAGIWHLDLKPDNIMLDKSGKIKLIDFGASKQLNVQKGGATASTAISYTKGYAPREQMEQNYDKFGPWTDIYALGATLYNLLTNKRPPLPTDIDDDMSEDKHLALPMPNVCDEMKELVLQMMKTNRLQRPQSVEDMPILPVTKKIKKEIIDENTIIPPSNSMPSEETIITPHESRSVSNRQTNTDEVIAKEQPIDSQESILVILPRTELFTAIKIALHEKFCYDLGRSRRSEFWWFVIFYFAASILISFLAQSFARLIDLCNVYLFAALAFAFTRRLHDSGHSGYWCLLLISSLASLPLSLIPGIQQWILLLPPLISVVTIIYLGCLDSEVGDNDYGESTKYVYVEKTDDNVNDDDDSLTDRLSSFFSNSTNVTIIIIAIIVSFLSYLIWNNESVNNNVTQEESSSTSSTNVIPTSVDLGLSVDWATFNLGASNSSEVGDYYWWASTNPVRNDSDAQYIFDYDGAGQKFIKYNNVGMQIASEDDAARIYWKDGWRIPTPDELHELVYECEWEKAEYMDMKGYNVIGKNGNKIFLPYIFNPNNDYFVGSYMSNALSNNVSNFYALVFSDKPIITDEQLNICVMSVERSTLSVIRPVKEK